MSDAQISDPYAVVLADLRAQRAKIDQAISAIESLRGIAPSAPTALDNAQKPPPTSALSMPH